MVRYRRNRVAGGCYFFTVALRNRNLRILTEQAGLLRGVFREVMDDRPFYIDAIVILPEHLHAIWTLPDGDDDYPGRWRSIKGKFSRRVSRLAGGLPRNRKGEHGLWQQRYWEHTIRDDAGLAAHVDYIHFNPVKHGWVRNVKDWPFSSFHRFVRQGICSPDWAGETMMNMNFDHGEPS